MSAVTDLPALPVADETAAASDDVPVPASITARLDAMTTVLEEMAAQLRAERAARLRWEELAHELMPVAQAAMQLASDELGDLSREVTSEDAVRFARTAARSLPHLERLLAQLGSASELVHEVTALSGAGVASLSGGLAQADRRGYFQALRHAGGIADRMALTLNRTYAERRGEPATLRVLLRQLRDPQTRQGLSTLLSLLAALPAAAGPAASQNAPTTSPSTPTPSTFVPNPTKE